MKKLQEFILKHLDADLTKLTKSQAEYIGVKVNVDLLRKTNIGINFKYLFFVSL